MTTDVADMPAPGYAFSRPIEGSPFPALLTFVPTRDEIYVPIAVRKPDGDGPFPVITMGRGDGRGGMPHVVAQVERLATMQDALIRRGYVVVYVNYRNEIPHQYGRSGPAMNLADDISGGENLTLKSAPTLDSDDLAAIWRYLQTLPFVAAGAIGAIGISHGGEMILKAAAEGAPLAAGVVAEGASHEFLGVDTGPSAPRIGGELQYNDIEVVRRNADKPAAMARIARISAPMLHVGRYTDHLQGIFRLAHEWMLEAGKASDWACFEHPEHGYCLVYPGADGAFVPDPVQRLAFDLYMEFFDRHLKPR
jgi:dienelactone hydrolase